MHENITLAQNGIEGIKACPNRQVWRPLNNNSVSGQRNEHVFSFDEESFLDSNAEAQGNRAGDKDSVFNCFYCWHDKGHERENELTIATMREGGDPTIPIQELIEVTQSTSAMESHW